MHYFNISRLHLENFQSIKEPVTFRFAPITLLYGQNSVGKSAIVDAMNILCGLCSGEYKRNELLECVHMHNSEASMVIGAGFDTYSPAYFWDDAYKYNLDDIFPELGSFIQGWEDDPRHVEYDIYFRIRNLCIENMEINVDGKKLINLETNGSRVVLNLANPYMMDIDNKLRSDIGSSFHELCSSVMRDVDLQGDNLVIEYVYADNDPFDGQMFGIFEHPFFENMIASEERQHVELLLSFMLLAPLNTYAHIMRNNLVHVGPLRKIPDSDDLFYYVRNADSERCDFERSVTNWQMNWFDGSLAWRYLAENHEYTDCSMDETTRLLPSVNDWLSSSNKLDMPYTIERGVKGIKYEELQPDSLHPVDNEQRDIYHEAIAEIRLKSKIMEDSNINLRLNDVGSGVSQVIPILVAGFVKKQVHIEQPELHLHPKLQTDLADYFIARWNHNELVSVIETHSEYLALRLLRRIRETKTSDVMPKSLQLNKSDIIFYYFDSIDGSTQVTELRVSDEGEFLDRWPKGFFSERERELFDEDYQ